VLGGEKGLNHAARVNSMDNRTDFPTGQAQGAQNNGYFVYRRRFDCRDVDPLGLIHQVHARLTWRRHQSSGITGSALNTAVRSA
jgi:hypothetical protein